MLRNVADTEEWERTGEKDGAPHSTTDWHDLKGAPYVASDIKRDRRVKTRGVNGRRSVTCITQKKSY